MRSDDWPRERSPGERRVLVMGDSVVAGGSLVDQAELATERLAVSLSAARGARVRTGNVAAPSWGPPNLVAWTAVHGWLGADAVVVVVSSHDADDVPTFSPLEARGLPVRRPASALLEGLLVYLPRLFAARRAPAESPGRRGRALDAFAELLSGARDGGRAVVVALHRQRSELGAGGPEALERLRALAEEAGAAVVRLGPAFRAALDRGEAPYRDDIHPTALGQGVIAGALERPLLAALGGS